MAGRALGVGVIGLGFMGRTHLAAYRAASAAGIPCRISAVCDRDALRLDGRGAAAGNLDTGSRGARLFDPSEVFVTGDPAALLARADVDLVSICTPTETHVELALAALAAGKHVLVEKPVALASADVARLAEAARHARTLCMPAFCMRFWPGWTWLRTQIRSGALGPVGSAVFQRSGTRPGWSDFYSDPARSGGALADLHVHDADFVRWCFGDPDEVASTGTLDHVTTFYRYRNGPAHVVAEGGWDHAPGFAFRMRFTVVFERGTADFEHGRAPELVLHRDGRSEPVALDPAESIGAYEAEVRHLVAAAAAGSRELRATMDDALAVARLLEAEAESLRLRPGSRA